MTHSGPTWIVLIRDVSHVVRVQGEPHTLATLILDAGTGLTRGLSVGGTAGAACAGAIRRALTEPAGPLPPQTPERVVFVDGRAEDVRRELSRALPDAAPATVTVSQAPDEAEEVFDAFVGQLAGRRQPLDPPAPTDWRNLYAQAAEYFRAAPWRLCSDMEHLDLFLKVDGVSVRYLAVILGQEGVQHGLALHPGGVLPPMSCDLPPGVPPRIPDGSLLLWLNEPGDSPAEHVAKAARYGWPEGLAEVPLPVLVTNEEPGDIDRESARRLTVAIAAVLAQHIAADATTTGVLSLDGELCDYRIGWTSTGA